MSVLVIPTRTDAPHYTIEVDLDSRTFELEFRWNDRAAAWFLTIRDADGVELLAGRRIVIGLPLLGRFRDPRLPAGELNAVELTGTDAEPGVDELGARVRLLYFEAGSLAA